MNQTRLALGIEYNGSQFYGWQMQSHGTRTVQETLEQALTSVADHAVKLTCAGRTDTGVHATAQVAHFDSQVERPLKAWVMGANALLPDDVSINWAHEVDSSFSARFSATRRAYRYVILNRRTRSAIYHQQVTWIYELLDANAMHQAAQALLGERDFSSFRSSLCQAEHARRFMESISVKRQGDFVYIDVKANAFLHHMVRNIVGSLLMIGRGERPLEWMAELMDRQDRTQAGPTAAAAGLYLVAVEYPAEFELPGRALMPQFN